MDAAEFDRLLARTTDPRLIPGIYNYCDGRCPRCAFTDRCLVFRDRQEAAAHDDSDASGRPSHMEMVGASLRRTLDALVEAARELGVDLSALTKDADAMAADARASLERHYDDPLIVRTREYGRLAWRIAKAIAPVVAARGDRDAIEAVETIEWFAVMIGTKLYRAVAGDSIAWTGDTDPQADRDGSAKVALLGIAESIGAWRVLMERGKAAADGVPARAVRMLEELDAEARERFPQAMTFVRPGFDEPGAVR